MLRARTLVLLEVALDRSLLLVVWIFFHVLVAAVVIAAVRSVEVAGIVFLGTVVVLEALGETLLARINRFGFRGRFGTLLFGIRFVAVVGVIGFLILDKEAILGVRVRAGQ